MVTSGLSKAFAMPGLRIGWAVGPESFVREVWERHDYTTLTPGMVSDILCGAAMEPGRRASILERTRGIVRAQLPRLEEWLHTHDDIFGYARPEAGAIAYVKYDLPVKSTPRGPDPRRAERPAGARATPSGSARACGSASATTSSTR